MRGELQSTDSLRIMFLISFLCCRRLLQHLIYLLVYLLVTPPVVGYTFIHRRWRAQFSGYVGWHALA